MTNSQNQFNVDSIIFESNDTDVKLRGTMVDGVFSYSSDLIINHSQLNLIINQISANNPFFAIDNYLEKTYMYEDNYMFEMNLHSLANNSIDLNMVAHADKIKEIRA